MKHEEVVQMRFISNLVKKYKRATPKQLMLGGVFAVAFAAAIGLGFAGHQLSHAAVIRDWDPNSIDNANYAGGPGAADGNELITDINHNATGDLPTIYASSDFGLTSGKYSAFASQYKSGMAYRDGTVRVDGQIVMTDAWSIGRSGFSYSTPYVINGKTYWKSMHGTTRILAQDLPVMVLFDSDGTADVVIMNACGNPVGGNRVHSGAECKELVSSPVSGKKNTYTFTTNAAKSGLANYVSFVYSYSYDNGKTWQVFDTKSNPGDATKEFTFTKTAQVKVEIQISLPGGKSKTVSSTLCQKVITVEEEKFDYVCKDLFATSADNLTFRFTVNESHSSNVTLVSADFALDGSATKGVTAKNSNGQIYKDYTFAADGKTHIVTAVVNYQYTQDGQLKKVQTPVSKNCTDSETTKKPPVCKYNPNLPPDSPDCKAPVCKYNPNLPPESPECKPETCDTNPSKEGCELPNTGPAGMAGLFAGVSAAGAAAHRVVSRLRRR